MCPVHSKSIESSPPERVTKGARTAERILDAAESLFAERGFEGSSLREIATRAGIRQPGIYNHFDDKRSLYAAVLDRALAPMLGAMQDSMAAPNPVAAYAALPGIMTDRLAGHPRMAALFHQVLQSDADSLGGQLMQDWLDILFHQGMETFDGLDLPGLDRQDRAIRILAMFNLTTGYFLSQKAFSRLVEEGDDLASDENIARQKKLLSRLAGSLLIE